MSAASHPAAAQGEILVAGEAGSGPALVLSAPISFWGGVDPKTGTIADVRHPEHGQSIAGRVLFLPGTIGSSSASAVLMELVHSGKAPARARSARAGRDPAARPDRRQGDGLEDAGCCKA